MRLGLVRTGGFGGTRLQTEVDVDACPAEEAQCWQELLDRALDTEPPAAAGAAPDRFSYRLVLEGSERQVDVQLAESQLVGAWRELADRLVEQARR